MRFEAIVHGEETLYRSIRIEAEEGEIELTESGYRVTTQGFRDRYKCPSVYRHNYCDKPPYSNPPRKSPTQAVISFTAKQVRALSVLHGVQSYIVDVLADPTPEEIAHAVIAVTPPLNENQKDAFKKLRAALRHIEYKWAIEPQFS